MTTNGVEKALGIAALTVIYRQHVRDVKALIQSTGGIRTDRADLKAEVQAGLMKYREDLKADLEGLEDQLETALVEMGLPDGSTMLDDAPYQRRRRSGRKGNPGRRHSNVGRVI